MVFSPSLPPSGLSQSASLEDALRVPRLADVRPGSKARLIPPAVLRGMARLSDFTVAAGTGVGVAASATISPAEVPSYSLAIVSASAATLMFLQALGLYSTDVLKAPLLHLPRVVLAWVATITILATAMLAVSATHEASRIWLLVWFGVGAVGLVAGRLAAGRMVRGWALAGRLSRRAAIYGGGDIAEDVLRRLEAEQASDIRITGVFDDRQDGRTPDAVGGYPRLGTLEALIAKGRETRLDLVIVALPAAGEKRLAMVAEKLSQLPADIRLPARATSLRLSPRLYSHIGPVAMIDLYDKPIANWDFVIKSAFDKIVSALALMLFSPLMLAIALAIKLDSSGSIFFRQTRYGFNNEPIEVLKFRSMYTNAADVAAAQLVTKGDARVTRVGRFIRKTSLDELPQLFNVLRGDLSLVGPRPHAPAAKADDRLYTDVVSHYFARHKVKPGMTGWAQVNGWRGETDTSEKIERRVEHDLYYIENWSVLFDLYILALTPLALFKTENAY
jgi:Undecaprenyl-phosphate glucose phosphotransferase